MKLQIEIYKIFRSDNVVVFCYGTLIGLWILFLLVFGSITIFGNFITETGGSIKEDDLPWIITAALIGSILCLICMIFRYLYFRNILMKQVLVKGIIKKVFYNNYNYIGFKFDYEYSDKIYSRKKQMAGKYKIPYHIKEGSTIGVLINPKRPKQFIIADLYTNNQYFM